MGDNRRTAAEQEVCVLSHELEPEGLQNFSEVFKCILEIEVLAPCPSWQQLKCVKLNTESVDPLEDNRYAGLIVRLECLNRQARHLKARLHLVDPLQRVLIMLNAIRRFSVTADIEQDSQR